MLHRAVEGVELVRTVQRDGGNALFQAAVQGGESGVLMRGGYRSGLAFYSLSPDACYLPY